MSLKYEPSSEPLHISAKSRARLAEHQLKVQRGCYFFFFITPSLELSDTKVYEP